MNVKTAVVVVMQKVLMFKIFIYNRHMDSKDFFDNKSDKDEETSKFWKGKSGIYCIEQPALSNANVKSRPVYKVGYARNSLYTRMSDYRSAYGVIPFKIYCLIQIPAGVVSKRSGYTLLSEQRLHKQLKNDGRFAGANEWYFDLSHILNVMYSLFVEFQGLLKNSSKWGAYFYDKRTRYQLVSLIDEKEIKSKLYDGIIYGTRKTRARSASETNPNPVVED